tara:strand:+ start:11164 stop:11349 length:186 start_codon:yes stop_codon:yes gene_type:complete
LTDKYCYLFDNSWSNLLYFIEKSQQIAGVANMQQWPKIATFMGNSDGIECLRVIFWSQVKF